MNNERSKYLLDLDTSKFDINFSAIELEVKQLNFRDYKYFLKPNIHPESNTLNWMKNTKNWKACDVNLFEMVEINKFYNVINQILECSYLKVTTCRALFLKADSILISHRHPRIVGQNHLCVNYLCGHKNSPITFNNYGDIEYKLALLNTTETHTVKSSPFDRFVLGIQLEYTKYWADWRDAIKLFDSLEYKQILNY